MTSCKSRDLDLHVQKKKCKNCITSQFEKKIQCSIVILPPFEDIQTISRRTTYRYNSFVKNTHSRSAFCHVQYSFSEIVLIHIIKFYTTHSFVWRKNNFCSTYPLRGTLKLPKSRITECTSEWYVFIRWWLVGSEMDLVIEWGVLTRYRGVNLFHEGLSRD